MEEPMNMLIRLRANRFSSNKPEAVHADPPKWTR